MKKSVKIIAIVIVLLTIIGIVFFAINTGNKKAITVERFEEISKENGYKIAEVQNEATDNENMLSAKAAIKEDNSYLINFYVLKDNDSAKSFYNDCKEKIEKDKKEEDKPTEKSEKNYDSYTFKSNKQYSYMARVDNTLVILVVDEVSEEEVTEFINKLGY